MMKKPFAFTLTATLALVISAPSSVSATPVPPEDVPPPMCTESFGDCPRTTLATVAMTAKVTSVVLAATPTPAAANIASVSLSAFMLLSTSGAMTIRDANIPVDAETESHCTNYTDWIEYDVIWDDNWHAGQGVTAPSGGDAFGGLGEWVAVQTVPAAGNHHTHFVEKFTHAHVGHSIC